MEKGIVRLSHPRKHPEQVRISASSVAVRRTRTSIYDTVDIFRDKILPNSKIKTFDDELTDRILLRHIMNLHNVDGIRDISQIKPMIQQIKSGEDVLSSDRLPNIRLVRTEQDEWVLFDGHHSLLAYMLSGKEFLDEVPHLIVEDYESGCVLDREIHIFFGKHQSRLRNANWRDYVINWQAQEEYQLQKRIQKNMGELLDSLFENGFRFH